MWSENVAKDLGDFFSSLVEDTKSLANIVTRVAADVTGRVGCIAGDEESLMTQECPLEETDIVALQMNDAVYLEPPQEPAEKMLFEEWTRRSVFSSANIHEHQSLLGHAGSGSGDAGAMAYRQRLLDNNMLVAEKYAALVQISERLRENNASAAAAADADAKKKSFSSEQEGVDENNNDTKDADKKNDEGEDENTRKMSDTPSGFPTTPLSDSRRITEDDFFDRYFFRLSQLRLRKAAERRKLEEEEAAARAAAEVRREQKASKKSFAERIMEVTDELVKWGDDDFPADKKGSPRGAAGDVRGRSRSRTVFTEQEWEDQENKINALESLVHLLQGELDVERRRLGAVLRVVKTFGLSESQTQQLQGALLPPSPSPSPVKDVAKTVNDGSDEHEAGADNNNNNKSEETTTTNNTVTTIASGVTVPKVEEPEKKSKKKQVTLASEESSTDSWADL